jgi:hypothetical protein
MIGPMPGIVARRRATSSVLALSDDLGLEPGDPQVERCELCDEYSQRLPGAHGNAPIALIGDYRSPGPLIEIFRRKHNLS